MTRPTTSEPARLTPAQALGWGIALLVVAGLVAMFFAYHTVARPLFETGHVEAAWPLS